MHVPRMMSYPERKTMQTINSLSARDLTLILQDGSVF